MHRIPETFKGRDIKLRQFEFARHKCWSITGPSDVVATQLSTAIANGDAPAAQIAQFGVKSMADGSTKVHIVLFDGPTGLIKKDECGPTLLSGYSYMHMRTALTGGDIGVALFDKGFEPSTQNTKAYDAFVAATYYGGRVKDTDSPTMLLLGRPDDNRVLTAKKNGVLRTIRQKLDGSVRYGVVGNHTIVTVGYLTGQVAALHKDDIAAAIKTNNDPNWRTTMIPGAKIEEISLSTGDTDTVLLTAKFEPNNREYVPATVKWTDDGKIQMSLARAWRTEINDDMPPIVRIDAKTKKVTAVDGNGGTTWYEASDAEEFYPGSSTFQRMVNDVSDGSVYAAAA